MIGCDKMEKEVIPLMRNIMYLFFLLIGVLVLYIASIPLLFAYPFSDGPNSGPSNTWELMRMMAYESWGLFLFIGMAFIIISVLGLSRKFSLYKFLS